MDNFTTTRQERKTSVMMNTVKNNIPLLTCAILAALTTGGPTYAFGLYGASLKENLHLTQSQLDTLSSANFCAGLFTWIPGLLVDKYGVRRSMALGGILGAVFMCLYWMVAQQYLPLHHTSAIMTALCACGIAFCIANGLVIGAIYKILVCSCNATTKGSAVGIAKGYVGLGSGVYACLFQAVKAKLHHASDLDFLPMAAVFALLACTLPALTLLPPLNEITRLWQLPKQLLDKTNRNHFILLYSGLLALAITVVGTSLRDLVAHTAAKAIHPHHHHNSTVVIHPLRHSESSHISNGILWIVLWFGPILALKLIPTDTGGKDDDDDSLAKPYHDLEARHGEHSPLMDHHRSDYSLRTESTLSLDDTTANNHHNNTQQLQPQHNYNLTELVRTCHAWLLLWIGLVLVGSGTMMTNNMGQMVESLRLEAQVTPASMALFSVAQATSRIFTGALSDRALPRFPRPTFLVVASIIAAVAHSLLALTPTQAPKMFLAGGALSGMAFGMIWPLMVLIVGEVFGTQHMATNYLFYDGFASAMGTLLLSKFVTQQVYESHITSTRKTAACFGTGCFALSHWVVVILALSCALAGMYLLEQTRHVYSRMRR